MRYRTKRWWSTNALSFSPLRGQFHYGMIATGNHGYSDSLRGAPPSQREPLVHTAKLQFAKSNRPPYWIMHPVGQDTFTISNNYVFLFAASFPFFFWLCSYSLSFCIFLWCFHQESPVFRNLCCMRPQLTLYIIRCIMLSIRRPHRKECIL